MGKAVFFLPILILFALSAIPFVLVRKKIKSPDFLPTLCPKCKKAQTSNPRISFLGFIEVHCGKCRKYYKTPLSNSLRFVYLVWLSILTFSFLKL